MRTMPATVLALIAAAALTGACSFSGVLAAHAHVTVTGNIALVPASPGAIVSPLPKRKVRVSWQQALRAARKAWGLETKQVEVIVRAAVSKDGNYGAGWAVVADMITHNPAPRNTTVYNQMVIVVSSASGKALFSYPTAPTTPAMAPPPMATPPPPGIYPPGSNATPPSIAPPATPAVRTSAPPDPALTPTPTPASATAPNPGVYPTPPMTTPPPSQIPPPLGVYGGADTLTATPFAPPPPMSGSGAARDSSAPTLTPTPVNTIGGQFEALTHRGSPR